MKNVFYLILLVFILLNPLCPDGNGPRNPSHTAGEDFSLGRIGFLDDSGPEVEHPADTVIIGIEVYRNVLYKLVTADENVVSAGMLSQGINSINIPVEMITGSNKGVFSLLLKEGKSVRTRQVLLLPDRYEVIEEKTDENSAGAVNDRFRHEMTVTGVNRSAIDMHNRIILDAVTGDYPGLSRGIPLLPILYLLGSKIYRSLKKKKRRALPLYSETELYVSQGKADGKTARLSLRILTTDDIRE